MPRGWSWGHKRESGYRSKEEERVAEWLTNHNVPFQYEATTLNYTKSVRNGACSQCGSRKVATTHQYTPDFALANGVEIEYKGRLTSQDRTKLIAVKKANPDVKLVILFSTDNKLAKNSNKRYSQWATDNGFDFSFRVPPARWLRGIER